jgi:hypothetical protein
MLPLAAPAEQGFNKVKGEKIAERKEESVQNRA